MTSIPALAARGLRPVQQLAASRPCGDRLRYLAGCRCVDCRRANSAYECERAKARRNGDWNGIVPAHRARKHLMELSRLGVGRNTVSAMTDIARSILSEVRAGRKKHIRARTERKILLVTTSQAADKSFVPAVSTWKLITKLLDEGYS